MALPRGSWQGVRHLLAVRLDNIGDLVMLGPALRTLRRRLPDASLTLMATPGASETAQLLPWVDDVVVHRPVWQDLSGALPLDPERERRLVETLRERRFDAAVIFTSFTQSPWPPAYACYLAGIPLRVGQSKEFGGSVLSHCVEPPPDSVHQVDRNLHLLERAGLEPAGRELELRVPAEAARIAEARLAQTRIDPHLPFVVLAPGASCAARRYDAERFARVALLLAKQTGTPVVLLGSERERELAERILAAGNGFPVVSLVGKTSVAEFAALVRRAALVVANDSAALHLADAFRRPLVVLFSGTDLESQWEPRSSAARLLRRPTACAPCYRFTCPYAMECLDIPPEEVVEAALALVGTASGGNLGLDDEEAEKLKGSASFL